MPDKELAIWKGTLCATNGFKGDGSRLTGIPTTSPAGSDGDIQFNDFGSFGADSDLYWDVGRQQLTTNLIKITSDGTQAAPALKFNDTNTGFYKSGDSVRFSLNNSTKMTINSTGMGIGTATPDGKFHVSTGGDTNMFFDSTLATGEVKFLMGSGAEGTIDASIIYDGGSDLLKFSNRGQTTDMTINGSGNVNIIGDIYSAGNVVVESTAPIANAVRVTGEYMFTEDNELDYS
ncbi:hypothetical protein LCGC14_2736200, partial [marine sediment metagenome]